MIPRICIYNFSIISVHDSKITDVLCIIVNVTLIIIIRLFKRISIISTEFKGWELPVAYVTVSSTLPASQRLGL